LSELRKIRRDGSSTHSLSKFIIAVGIFERQIGAFVDTEFNVACITMLGSVARQTYTNWTLSLVGDGLSADQIAKVFSSIKRSNIDGNKILFVNMRRNLREPLLYREKNVWKYAGTNVLNLALDVAYSTTAEYIARIDDDDAWREDHLQNLLLGYTRFSNASFAFSQALFKGSPFPQEQKGANQNGQVLVPRLQSPEPCGVIHATTSWSISRMGFLYFRHSWEQLRSPRFEGRCCGKPCQSYKTIMPVDADMWERVWGLVNSGNISSIFIPMVDTDYTVNEQKQCLANVIQSAIRNRSLAMSQACEKQLNYIAKPHLVSCLKL